MLDNGGERLCVTSNGQAENVAHQYGGAGNWHLFLEQQESAYWIVATVGGNKLPIQPC